ncbi:MAG: beta strand repeat-containing protein [Novosphingobium sp.]
MSDWISSVSGSWFSAANWNQGAPTGIGTIAQFFLSSATPSIIVDIPDGSTVTIGTINVTQNSVTNLTIRSSGIGLLVFNGSNGLAQVNVSNTAPTGTFSITPGFDTRVRLDSDIQFNLINSDSFARVSAPISGFGAIVKVGPGILSLEGSNTFLGGMMINGGLLSAFDAGSLSTGRIALANNGVVRTVGSAANLIETSSGAVGTAGSGQILAPTGGTLTLTGVLSHLSQGTLTFGSATSTGTIIASFSSIAENLTTSGYTIGGGTLRLDDAFVAANLFSRPGTGLTKIAGTLDTGGFSTTISNLDMDGGSIIASAGALIVTVNHSGAGTIAQAGVITGTGGFDGLTVNTTGNINLNGISFSNWNAALDQVTINGSAAANTITGSTTRDTIFGFDGNDTLIGNGGIDTFDGGNGTDLIILNGLGDGSTVNGGAGSDIISIESGSVSLAGVSGMELIEVLGGATLILNATQVATGFASATTLAGAGTLTIAMAPGNTVFLTGYGIIDGTTLTCNILGSTGIDVIKCALGVANTISGNGDIDQIRGGNLADTINGGDGNDKIMGLGGADLLTGGTGADQFRYLFTTDAGTGAGADQILDFLAGTDKLDFRTLDANAAIAGRQALSYVGTAAFASSGAAQVRWTDLGADLRVEVDLDGNGVADMAMLLVGAGAQTLTATDFLL